MNIDPSKHVCGIAHCTLRTFETKYTGEPRVGFHAASEKKVSCISIKSKETTLKMLA